MLADAAQGEGGLAGGSLSQDASTSKPWRTSQEADSSSSGSLSPTKLRRWLTKLSLRTMSLNVDYNVSGLVCASFVRLWASAWTGL
jgi:hypothetical protein